MSPGGTFQRRGGCPSARPVCLSATLSTGLGLSFFSCEMGKKMNQYALGSVAGTQAASTWQKVSLPHCPRVATPHVVCVGT